MKRIKTLIVLTMAFGALTFSSCKKDKQNPIVTASITADIGGVATAFNAHPIAGRAVIDGHTVTTITGSASNGSIISVTLTDAVTAGKTYSASTTPGEEPILSYEAGTDDFLNDDDASNNKVSVTINSQSSTTISGTFTGGVASTNVNIGSDAPTTPKKSITNGKFNVSIIISPHQ